MNSNIFKKTTAIGVSENTPIEEHNLTPHQVLELLETSNTLIKCPRSFLSEMNEIIKREYQTGGIGYMCFGNTAHVKRTAPLVKKNIVVIQSPI